MLLFRNFDDIFSNFDAFFDSRTRKYRDSSGNVFLYEDGFLKASSDKEGTLKFYENGVLSNKKGAAVEYKDGKKEYWIDGRKTNKEEVDKLIRKEEENRKEGYTLYLTKSEKEKVEAALGRKL
jgi:hypothetical protein